MRLAALSSPSHAQEHLVSDTNHTWARCNACAHQNSSFARPCYGDYSQAALPETSKYCRLFDNGPQKLALEGRVPLSPLPPRATMTTAPGVLHWNGTCCCSHHATCQLLLRQSLPACLLTRLCYSKFQLKLVHTVSKRRNETHGFSSSRPSRSISEPLIISCNVALEENTSSRGQEEDHRCYDTSSYMNVEIG